MLRFEVPASIEIDVTVAPAALPHAPLACLEARNRQAEARLAWHARKHAIQDGASGGMGALIPFASPFVAAGQLAAQAKSLYPTLARELTAIYACPEGDFREAYKSAQDDERQARAIKRLLEMHKDDLAQLTLALVAAFDGEFLIEIARDLAQESAPAALVGMIPFFGAPVAAAFDATLAATMTWRVGSMVALHLQHGSFVGNRKNSWTLVKNRLVGRSPDWERPQTLTRLRSEIPSVRTKLAADACRHGRLMVRAGLSPVEARIRLAEDAAWRVPADLLPRSEDLVAA